MSIHSIDGIAWSARLEHIGVVSARNKNMVFNNIGHHVNETTLKRCFDRIDGTKAVGVDGVTKEGYGKNLESNLRNLMLQIRKGTYVPKPARIVEIPKEDGSTRPLAISCLEDKIVQMCVNNILTRIYEPLFLPCSYGARPNRSCIDALRDVNQTAFKVRNGAIVEIDLRRYFNSIPHKELLSFLKMKVSDQRFLRLVEILLRTPIIAKGVIEPSDMGAPQGSILSPLVANVYLHHVLDLWFAEINQSHFKGKAKEIRFMDDAVFFFENLEDAKRFFQVLPKRFEKYGLQMHLGKSQILPSGSRPAMSAHLKGERIPAYCFLGFECYWGWSLNKKYWRLKIRSRSDRLRKAIKGLKSFLTQNLNTRDQGKLLSDFVTRIKGWINYHAVSDNHKQVKLFLYLCQRLLLRWFRRRGGRQKMTWDELFQLLPRIGFPQTFKVTSLYLPLNNA